MRLLECTVLFLLLYRIVPICSSHLSSCSFNSMCLCSSDQHNLDARLITDVSCIAVPFFKLPNLPEGDIKQLEVAGSNVPALEAESLAGCQVHSLTLSNNHLQHVAERAFSSMSSSLKSLDLSYNELDAVPFQALKELRNLQWINLHGNRIQSISGDWSHVRTTLMNLFLGENDITEIPNDAILTKSHHGLHQFKSLVWLNLDGNRISKIHKNSLPPTLQTVSLSHNLIEDFPVEIILNLPRLQWLYLRGNHIRNFPVRSFHRKLWLEKIDLGENYLTSLREEPFNNSVFIRDLNLAFNEIKVIVNKSFSGLQCGRIILSHNNIDVIEEDGFGGIETTLEFLDFDHNDLTSIPTALSQLQSLKYLYLSSNLLTEIPVKVFDGFCDNLRALSFSGNQLSKIPSDALQNCTKISHFNAAYNKIYDLTEYDFETWGQNIKNLILGNNRISLLKDRIFAELKELKELSLSFNPIRYIDDNAFEGLEGLESLELSFGLEVETISEQIFKHVPNLQWLSADNNDLHAISESFLSFLPEVRYLNLESNRLRQVPVGIFSVSTHGKLREVRLSNNVISRLNEKTFNGLQSLETVTFANNRIRLVEKNSFYNLPTLATVILSNNELATLDKHAFVNLPKLHLVDLHNNHLTEFSFDVFVNVTHPMLLNISSNRISSCSTSRRILSIEVLDSRQNYFSQVPSCVDSISLLKKLLLSDNEISMLEHNSFMHLTSLEVLDLERNNIVNIHRRAFFGLQNLQILDLSHNSISLVHINQFSNTPKLRILDMSNNNLNYLPKEVFTGTILEKLDLNNNFFSVVPTLSLTEVGITLRHFCIGYNNIEHVDSTTFPDIPFQYLDLSSNKFTILPDNVFTSLGFLQNLILNSNQIRANFKELFHYAQNLKKLSLASSGIISTPTLPLPNLISLNLSYNNIEIINRNTVQKLGKLKLLDLSHNFISHIPAYLWIHLPHLKTLDISYNPIKELLADHFHGLRNLQHLNIQGLKSLRKYESASITQIQYLSTLLIETWPMVENFQTQLCETFAKLEQLRILKLLVRDSVLDDQLLCVSNKKIRHLEITGRQLRVIDRKAFAQFTKNPDLVLRISGTQVEELPAGLFANMYKVSYLRIDLRDNMLSYLSPEVFYGNSSTWKNVGTTLISGGLALSGNPFKCGCHLTWLGYWLRRWMRESLQSHSAPVDAAATMTEALHEATCTDIDSGVRIPIVQLLPEDMSCHASALSTAPTSTEISVISILLCYVFYHVI
ncbi:chaoptin-like [Onthophagus taurus]|uniref:chaoptin-like n=1 Tax=Onthophagus taurus TaxID=166361 RepID=UPI000C1FE96A|nr:chaoptin-like [Onthophagus taurus]